MSATIEKPPSGGKVRGGGSGKAREKRGSTTDHFALSMIALGRDLAIIDMQCECVWPANYHDGDYGAGKKWGENYSSQIFFIVKWPDISASYLKPGYKIYVFLITSL